MDDRERLCEFVSGGRASGLWPDVVLFGLVMLGCILGLLWTIVCPVVGMLYMLGYLT